jgi:hypothetical protein
MANSGLRIAWFSDLSARRSESLSTYCTRLLVPELTKRHAIEIFTDDATATGESAAFGAPVLNYLNAYKRHRDAPFDIFFYQLEDSRACRFIRGHIGLVPGVVWVHDLFCNDLGPEACHTSPWEHTIRQYFYAALDFSDRSKAPHQLWPRAFRETSLCPVVLFSSPWAQSEFKRMVSNRLESGDGLHHSAVLPAPVEAVSTFYRPVEGPFNIATTSVPGIEGRSHKVLPSLHKLKGDWHLTWMIDPHELRSAQELVSEFEIPQERVTFVVERSVTKWANIVGASHVALHLHTSPFGHLAPFIQLSLGCGTPAVVARLAQGEDFPDDVVFGITPGLHEAAELQAVFEELMSERARQQISGGYGALGARYISETSGLAVVADRLSQTLSEAAPHVSYVMGRWQAISRRAGGALLNEVRDLVSAGNREVVSAYDSVIAPAVKELGWGV